MQQRSTPRSTRALVLCLLVSLFLGLLPMPQMNVLLAEAAEADKPNPGGGLEEIRETDSTETRYGLVAVLVDEETWESRASGEGIFSLFGRTPISTSVRTYAEDIQDALPWTKSIIITVGKEDTPVEIQRLLERLYFEGNPSDSDPSKLTGVVLVGDVALPVVNKNGYRFLSLLPYTDFEDPSYVLDGATQDFLPNAAARNLQMEVWHGVIVPPLDGQAGIDLLTAYFDKNHRFHVGDEDYTTFDQKAFIGDFITEEDTLNKISFDSYKRFTRLWEELAYYRYSNDLVEELYTELMDGVSPGDGLDNDQDELYDEEAQNSQDDDGDGLVDEDLGDNFYGIDNDEDGAVDEDGFADNNNDINWVHDRFGGDPDADYIFQDQALDEDPPGDSNGDGCPYICGEAGPMLADHDNDGFPSSWEIVNGFNPYNPRKPYMRASKKANKLYGTSFPTDSDEGDAAATTYLAELIVEDMYGADLHASCFAPDGSAHPEWDDDGDFFCDEDGSSENTIWLNDNGARNPIDCAYNDGDCDGIIDEDPTGLQPEARFELLPDIQALGVVKTMISRYAEIFDQPQGVWNRIVAGTGRYEVRELQAEGGVTNDYDSDVSLIAKKDEVTLQYLKEVNDTFENAISNLVEEELQQDVPLVMALQLNGTILLEGEEDPEDFCAPGQGMDGAEACLQFVNHSTGSEDKSFDGYKDNAATKQIRFFGQRLWELPNVGYCSPYGGTQEEGGQLTVFSALFSGKESGVTKVLQAKKVKNCMSENRPYLEDIPELCEPELADNIVDGDDSVSIRALDGGIIPDLSAEEIAELEIGFPACFDFKEMNNFKTYAKNNGGFSDWLSRKLRKFRKEDSQDDEEAYSEFLAKVEEEKAQRNVDAVPDKTPYSSLDLIPDSSRRYTVTNLFEDMGWTDFNDRDIDVFLGLREANDPLIVDNPQRGTGMGDVARITVIPEKIYLEEDSFGQFGFDDYGASTQTESEAQVLSSVYKHVEPTNATLNAQIQSGATPDLPIDVTRRINFLDKEDQEQELIFPNVFGAQSYESVAAEIQALSEQVSAIPGGAKLEDDVFELLELINPSQLEDALTWSRLNIDEKHHYVLTHYLGQEEPLVAKARNGYEMVSLIAEGDSDELFFAFDGSRPLEEGDLEWQHRSEEAIAEALAIAQREPSYEPLSGLSNTTPVPLADWIVEIAEWMQDLKGTLSSYDTDGGENACGDPLSFKGSTDEDGTGIPDGADPTVSLELTSEDNNVLQADGQDQYVVSVSSHLANGELNHEDSFTEVELLVLSGDDSVSVSGSDRLKLTGGIASFILVSDASGPFTIQARSVNRSEMEDSNTLSGAVTSKLVKVTTYRTDAASDTVTLRTGNRVELKNEAGEILGVFDPATGALELRGGARAELLEATAELPTRVAIVDKEGFKQGSLFMIPEEDKIMVREVASGAEANNQSDGSVELKVDGRVVGLVGPQGQIGIEDTFFLAFQNAGEINLYDPIEIRNTAGTAMFTVELRTVFDEAELEKATGPYANFLSWAKSLFKGPVAHAASQVVDSDKDLLNDLEEWTIGTDLNLEDSDQDGYKDGEEIFSGFDPLGRNEDPLFTDIDASHDAYADLVTLYLRGVIKGYGDGSFRPDQAMTREEFVKVDLGAICISCDRFDPSYKASLMQSYGQDPFPDTDINPGLLACVAEAKVDGIVSGYGSGVNAGYFLPRRNISRAEATKVLVETAELPTQKPRTGEPWYQGYVDTAKSYDLFPPKANVNKTWLEGNITRAEFVMMSARLVDVQDCQEEDRDGDGLNDRSEELVYGTNPDSADTDQGGIPDLKEVLSDMDPLDARDDDGGSLEETPEAQEETPEQDFSELLKFRHQPGLYVVSDHATYEEIATGTGDGTASVNVFTNKTPADGQAKLFVRAEIRDQNNQLYSEDNSSVIEFILSSEDYGIILSKRVQVQKGQAETSFLSSKLAGEVKVEARITDGSLPSEGAVIEVYPGDPIRLELNGQSTVLPAGGESVNKMTVSLFDEFGNLASNGFHTITLSTEGGIEILDLFDEDLDSEGVQVTTPDGILAFRVLSSPKVESTAVLAQLQAFPDRAARFEIEHVESLTLSVETQSSFAFVGGESPTEVQVSVKNNEGEVVSGFQGEVQLSMSDPAYGSFLAPELVLQAGQATAQFLPGTLSGFGQIIAESPGIEGGSAPIELKPGATFELRIRKEDDTNVLSAGKRQKFFIEGYDVYGNLASTDSSTNGTIRSTTATETYASLSQELFELEQGLASFYATPINGSGTLNLVAAAEDLLAGTWGGEIQFSLSAEEIAQIQPQMLYASVLGAPFGDVTQPDYIAGWLTFNGKTQAVTSLLSQPVPKKQRALLDSKGSITLPEGSDVSTSVRGAGSSLPLRIQWREFPGDRLQAELFYVLPDTQDVEGELLSTRGALTLENKANEWLLREDSAAVVKVRSDGQIVILDPSYFLAINASAEGLGFVILHGTDQVATFNFNDPWQEDVKVLASDFDLNRWTTLQPGLYLKPTSETEHHLVAAPSGNSSKNAQGIALIDPEEDLPEELQPSLGYQSLESANENGVIGWEKDNKHLLLFAAGNTVGQSNLYYGSEIGIVLGDPTIALTTPNTTNELGFTEDVGTLISASQKDVTMLVDTDYNADGLIDVLMAYEDGRIEVLQNYNAPVRLQGRGALLSVENGISSIEKGDFNKDGMEDLLIVTKTACYVDEMCLYLYENIGGGYVAKNLTFDEIEGKPKQVEVGDLNGDRYDDVVLVNENMKLYVIWNNRGELSDVDLIRDFGLRTESSQNLFADLALHHDGQTTGSINLSVLQAVVAGDEDEKGPNAFLDLLDLPAETQLSVDGEAGGGSVSERKLNMVFESAAQEAISERFVVDKRVDDVNGGKIEIGDQLRYSLTVINRSEEDYEDLYLSDLVSGSFRYIEDSLDCDDCEVQAGNLNRPWVAGPLTLEAGASLQLNYLAEARMLPSLQVLLANDFFEDYTNDDYLDLVVSPEGNSTGAVRLYYSDGFIQEDGYRRINYREKEYSPELEAAEYASSTLENPFGDSDGNGVPDFVEGADPDLGFPVPPAGSVDIFKDQMGATDKNGDGYYSSDEMYQSSNDADGDGLIDSIDQWNSDADLNIDATVNLSPEALLTGDAELSISAFDDSLEGIVGVVEDAISMLTCSGGCLAMPGSISFLTPGDLHNPFTGTTMGTEFVGTPVFGVLGYPSYVCSGQACAGSQVLRLYLSPTTTLGLGMALCLGPHPSGQCWAFNIPLLQALGVCDAINGFMADALSGATSFSLSDSGNQLFNISGSQGGSGQPSGVGSSLFEGYTPPIAANTNIQVPGFPSVFTEWWKQQKFEFLKMLDLPDITFIYPDPNSIAAEFKGGENREKDGEKQVEELESGMLGLEKFLNLANGLPLIDIEPQTVYIHYPTLTTEEIELVQADWQDWVTDTKTEWESFSNGFTLREDVSDLEQEAYDSMNEVMDDAIAGMEANLAVLETYKDIPFQILKIRGIQSSYAKIIVCYLDAILNYTVGYLTENAGRIEAWGQWVVDLKSIVSDWQSLIDVSVDMMDSCDKCTNQRMGSYQILLALFAFIPEFPVIVMPKLPDIVIDVSNIQAGVDIKWPEVKFVPETVHLPEIPRLNLPNAGVGLDANIDLDLNIPVLPEFPLNFELPELPGLPLPDLPSLPPPPAIPQFHPAIKTSVEVGGAIIKIICIIRSGFIPVMESKLKAQIEEITERPGDVVLPFDLKTTVEFPEISFDFLERIEITTYLKLTADFDALYNLVDDIGKLSNGLVDDLVSEFDRSFDQLNTGLQDAAGSESRDLQLDLDLDLDLQTLDPAVQIAEEYKDHPLVASNLQALVQNLETLQTQVDAWSSTLPESVDLVASQNFLEEDDPLLHRYDAILAKGEFDSEFLASIEGTPLASVNSLRNSLLSYVEDWDNGTTRLAGLDGEAFNRYLAQESQLENPIALASQYDTTGYSGTWNPLALVTPQLDPHVELAEETVEASQPKAFNEGIFISNPELGVGSRLMDYTEEADGTVNVLFVDTDGDGDEDIVYSMGGDVYIKENHTKRARLSYVGRSPEVFTMDELLPARGSFYNMEEGRNGYQEASFGFTAPYEAAGYDLSFYDSLDAQESAPKENLKRFLLLADVNGPTLPSEDSRINMQASRIVAKNLSGKATLYKGFKRTPIQANGELTVETAVVLQSTKDSVLTISTEEGRTSLDIPAYTQVSFGKEKDRTLRVERGEFIWIQKEETVDFQEAREGMELLPGEALILESGSAQADLLTSEGASLRLDNQELFVMDRMNNPENPSVRVDIENGAFYVQGRALYTDGQFGTLSDNILLNPQICGDKSAPIPIVDGPQIRDLAIFSTLELSAKSSFDSDTGVASAAWDFDANVDSNGDGNPKNDEDAEGLIAKIGPYEDTTPREVTLWVTDLVGNKASTSILVNVYVPNIFISEANPSEVNGGTDPASPFFPFTLVRERNGVLEELGDFETESSGDFSIEMNDSENLAVYDAQGQIIAEFNPTTKQLLVTDDAFEAGAVPSGNEWPSHLVVSEKASDMVMGSFIVLAESSRFVNQVFEPLAQTDLSLHKGVTVYVANDASSYTVTKDGVLGKNESGVVELSISPDGNITFFDSRFELKKRAADSLDEYLVLEVYDQGKLELEIWPGDPESITITDTETLKLPPSVGLGATAGSSAAADFRLLFEDIKPEDPLYKEIGELVERGVLQGYEENGARYFKPDQSITRAEFTKIILSVLCITPRPEAYRAPAVFNDINDTDAWYYPFTKESQLLGLIEGYQGELDADGMAPFKPEAVITRAEATKIVLEALDQQGIIELPAQYTYGAETGRPWFEKVLEIGQDLTPYLTGEESGGNSLFVLTKDEAKLPNEKLTRYQFVEMSLRVLQAYNCFELDSDQDGLFNFDEETKYKTDPYNPDTDAGGITDGVEVGRGTDPLNPEDDFDQTGPEFAAGIYAVQEMCMSCPCDSSIDYVADLRPGDKVFAIIQNALGQIFGISNTVEL